MAASLHPADVAHSREVLRDDCGVRRAQYSVRGDHSDSGARRISGISVQRIRGATAHPGFGRSGQRATGAAATRDVQETPGELTRHNDNETPASTQLVAAATRNHGQQERDAMSTYTQ